MIGCRETDRVETGAFGQILKGPIESLILNVPGIGPHGEMHGILALAIMTTCTLM